MVFDPLDIFGQKRRLAYYQVAGLTIFFFILYLIHTFTTSKKTNTDQETPNTMRHDNYYFRSLFILLIVLLILSDTIKILTGASIKWSFIRVLIICFIFLILFFL